MYYETIIIPIDPIQSLVFEEYLVLEFNRKKYVCNNF